jgi:sigma-B regulation protein RsbU (phosphoserine phosphatase)
MSPLGLGGDHVDYLPRQDRELAIIVADICGHGLSAALVKDFIAREIRETLTLGCPALGLAQLNRSICRAGLDGMFVTLVLAVLDSKTHVVTIFRAGHHAPLLRRHNGRVEETATEEAGPLLGVISDAQYAPAITTLAPGDCLFLYTDGVTEAMSDKGECYGAQRLQVVLGSCDDRQAERVLQSVRTFSPVQKDDICMVTLQRSRFFRGEAGGPGTATKFSNKGLRRRTEVR